MWPLKTASSVSNLKANGGPFRRGFMQGLSSFLSVQPMMRPALNGF